MINGFVYDRRPVSVAFLRSLMRKKPALIMPPTREN